MTKRVYLATALACSLLEEETARFTSLKVKGKNFETTLEPVLDCLEQMIFNSFVFDVPVPTSGELQITPGNQPGTALNITQLTSSGVATDYYTRRGQGRFEMSVTEYEKTDDVKSAA